MTAPKKGRPGWVAGKVVANLDERRKRMFDELLAHYRATEPRTTQTNVIERAIDLLHADELAETELDTTKTGKQ